MLCLFLVHLFPGSHLVNLYSRFTESIPAHLPTAAKLLALSPYGGSSIHIKAEVTHGAGECTNEALAVMMGGSSSCWCNLLFWKFQLRFMEGLFNMVDFFSDLIISICCINDTILWTSHYYFLNKNLYSYPNYQNPYLVKFSPVYF